MQKLPKPDRIRPRIKCDFYVWDERGVYPLNGRATIKDLEHHGLVLSDGMVLTFYDSDEQDDGTPDNLLVTGTARWNPERQRWDAEVDWDTMRHESELDAMGEAHCVGGELSTALHHTLEE